MAHIRTGNNYPGILSLLWFKPSTGKEMSRFAEALLRGPSTLSSGERETIAAHVSKLNQCRFCHDSHSAAAATHLATERGEKVDADGIHNLPQSAKMKALLKIAAEVQKGGQSVEAGTIAEAKESGASDEDIHDAVLISAAFCMFNRYVDGLGTAVAPKDKYSSMGKRLAEKGYRMPPWFLRPLVRLILDREFKI